MGGPVGCSASPAGLPSVAVGEALAEESGEVGAVVVAAAPVGGVVISVKPRSPGLGLAVGAEDPPKPLSSGVVGEELAEATGEGGTVVMGAAPLGDVVFSVKPRSPGLGLAVGAEDPPKPRSSIVVGEALAETTGDGDTVVAAAPVGEGVIPAKPRSSGLGFAVGAEDPPKPLSSVVVGEALAKTTGERGAAVPVEAPVGEGVFPAKPRSRGLGLAVGAEDWETAPPKPPLSVVVVGEALAENRGEGGTVAAPVGDGVTTPNPRLPGPGLGVGVEGWSPEGAGEACSSTASLPSAGAGDDAADGCCCRGGDMSSVGDGVEADEPCPPKASLLSVGAGDADGVGCSRAVDVSSVGDGVGIREGRNAAAGPAPVGDVDGAGDDCPRGVDAAPSVGDAVGEEDACLPGMLPPSVGDDDGAEDECPLDVSLSSAGGGDDVIVPGEDDADADGDGPEVDPCFLSAVTATGDIVMHSRHIRETDVAFRLHGKYNIIRL